MDVKGQKSKRTTSTMAIHYHHLRNHHKKTKTNSSKRSHTNRTSDYSHIQAGLAVYKVIVYKCHPLHTILYKCTLHLAPPLSPFRKAFNENVIAPCTHIMLMYNICNILSLTYPRHTHTPLTIKRSRLLPYFLPPYRIFQEPLEAVQCTRELPLLLPYFSLYLIVVCGVKATQNPYSFGPAHFLLVYVCSELVISRLLL